MFLSNLSSFICVAMLCFHILFIAYSLLDLFRQLLETVKTIVTPGTFRALAMLINICPALFFSSLRVTHIHTFHTHILTRISHSRFHTCLPHTNWLLCVYTTIDETWRTVKPFSTVPQSTLAFWKCVTVLY